jgi:hypothetical protein
MKKSIDISIYTHILDIKTKKKENDEKIYVTI